MLTNKTLGFVGAASIVLFLAASPLNAAMAPRSVEIDPQHRTDAVTITEVDVGTVSVQSGIVIGRGEVQPVTPFQADDDWLNNTSIVLLNRTNKTIVWGQITLAFPETGAGTAGDPQRVAKITVGQLPPTAVVTRAGQPVAQLPTTRPPLNFGPGQRMTLRLSDYKDQIATALESIKPAGTLTKCRIHLTAFFFEDGLRWDGSYSVPDPERPGKYKQMNGGYFPGTPVWPPKPEQ